MAHVVQQFARTLAVAVAALCLFAIALPGPSAHAATAACNGMAATIVGSSGDDHLIGTDGNDVIVAFGGNDLIEAGDGDDVVCAGPGDDTVLGGNGDDVLRGQAGDDTIFGDHGECFDLDDPAETDWRRSKCDPSLPGGDDVVTGGTGRDFLSGDEQSDKLFGGPDDDIIFGSFPTRIGFFDELDVDPSTIDRLWGADGNDQLHAFGTSRVFAGDGDDHVVTGGVAGSTIRAFGEDGNDRFRNVDDDPNKERPIQHEIVLFGGAGNDSFDVSTFAAVTIYGGPGNDVLASSTDQMGSLRAYGGPGDDHLTAALFTYGPVVLEGGEGNDLLTTVLGTRRDGILTIARGGPGNDKLLGRELRGGPGDDELFLAGRTKLTRGGDGNDLIVVSHFGAELVHGDAGNDIIFIEYGRGFSPTIIGGDGDDACGQQMDPTLPDGPAREPVLDCEATQDEPPFDVNFYWELYGNVWGD